MRPAKPQISLRIRAVWSEPLLVAWIFFEYWPTNWTSFGVSKLKRMHHRLVWVYSCQNATLLEITCRGSFIMTKGCSYNVDCVYGISCNWARTCDIPSYIDIVLITSACRSNYWPYCTFEWNSNVLHQMYHNAQSAHACWCNKAVIVWLCVWTGDKPLAKARG